MERCVFRHIKTNILFILICDLPHEKLYFKVRICIIIKHVRRKIVNDF